MCAHGFPKGVPHPLWQAATDENSTDYDVADRLGVHGAKTLRRYFVETAAFKVVSRGLWDLLVVPLPRLSMAEALFRGRF